MIKQFLEQHTVLGTLARRRRQKRFEKEYTAWKTNGGALPMPHFGKQQVVWEYAARFGLRVFVETGTYTGHMVYAMLDKCDEIYSIELDHRFAENAARRFAGYRHVHIVQGDSSRVLPRLLAEIHQPCLFWLDAHYSGSTTAKGEVETPILQELTCILGHENAERNVLLIDDARCFDGTHDYAPLDEVKGLILRRMPGWVVDVKDDIIRAHAR